MIPDVLRSLVLGFIGMAIGCGIAWWVASTWTEINVWWVLLGPALSVLGLERGLSLSDTKDESYRTRLRVLLALTAAMVCAVGNYLTFVILSRTWYANEIPTEHQEFLYQLLHPSVLPSFGETGADGQFEETTWMMYLFFGLIGGPIVFWILTKRK